MEKKQIDLLLIFDLVCKLFKLFQKRQRKALNETPPDVPQILETLIQKEHRRPY